MFKPLRVLLALLAIILIVFATPPETEVILHGKQLIPTLLLPVLSPIIFFVLLLDVLMLMVFLTEKVGRQRTEYRLALYFNLILAIGLLLRWVPYFSAL